MSLNIIKNCEKLDSERQRNVFVLWNPTLSLLNRFSDFTHLTAMFWVPSTWAQQSARYWVHKDKYFKEFMFNSGNQSKNRGWTPFIRSNDRDKNWNLLKNHGTEVLAPNGVYVGQCWCGRRGEERRASQSVRLTVGRCSLNPLRSVPAFHRKQQFADIE